jgi:hypothetical protein
MVNFLAFYDASFGCYTADRQTDIIQKINTSLIGRGKKCKIKKFLSANL